MAHAHAAQHCFKLLTQHGHWGHPVHSEPEAANRMLDQSNLREALENVGFRGPLMGDGSWQARRLLILIVPISFFWWYWTGPPYQSRQLMETVELLAAQQGDVEGAQGLGDVQEVAAPDWLSWWRVQCILHCSGAMRVRKPLSSGWQLAWFAAFMAPPRFWLVLIVTLVYVLPVRAPHLR